MHDWCGVISAREFPRLVDLELLEQTGDKWSETASKALKQLGPLPSAKTVAVLSLLLGFSVV